MALIVFHLQDEQGRPLGGVRAVSTGGPGPWEAGTNACGDVVDPITGAAGVTLDPGHYEITFSKAGYVTLTLPADLELCGIITQALVKSSSGSGPERPVKPGVLPPLPTRAQVCSIQHSLAGLTYHTTEFGDVPAWFYGKLNEVDRAEARACHRAAGDTHIPIPLTEAYREPGTLWPPLLREGYDYTSDDGLRIYRTIAREAIEAGFFIDCAMGADGLGVGPGYNDEVGKTYGWGWCMNNMARMIAALQGDGTDANPDLTPYIIFRPGWDGCFYGWGGEEPAGGQYSTPLRWRFFQGPKPAPLTTKELDEQQQRVKLFGEKFRSVLPEGFLAIEHTPGNIPAGEGGGDYASGGLMTTYDTILSEFDTVHQDSYWQIVGRMVEHYVRPADQPAGDDPHPPWYLAPGSPRGPYFYNAFEPAKNGVYEWCRGRCSIESMKQEDAYMRATGVTLTGYPVNW